MKFLKAVIIIFAIFPYLSLSEELELTLNESIRIALEKNPNLLAMQKRIDEAKSQEHSALAGFLPKLDLSAMKTVEEKLFTIEIPSFIPGQPPTVAKFDFTKDYQYTLRMTQTIFTGGKLISSYNQARLNTDLTKELERQTKQDLIFEVKKAYFGVLLSKEILRVSESALSLAEKNLERTKKLLEVGVASRLDQLRAEVQVANLKPQVIRAKNALELAEAGFKTLLGLKPDDVINLKENLTYKPVEIEPERIFFLALEKRPEINQLKIQKRMSQEMLKLAIASYIPNVAVAGDFNWRADRFAFSKRDLENYYTINLVVTLPLFDGFSREAVISRSKAGIERSEYLLKGVKQSIALDVKNAILSFKEAQETYESQKANITQAEETVRIAELNYEEGLATYLDVLSAHMALTEAKTNLAQALYNYNVALAKIERAVSVPLEELIR
ncbi:MAG: TolC family protein [Candidatus Aminicenantia bacterium]